MNNSNWMLSKDEEFMEICRILERNGWLDEALRLKIENAFENWNSKVKSCKSRTIGEYLKEVSKKVCIVLDNFDVSDKDSEQQVNAILMQMIWEKTYSWRKPVSESVWAENEFVMNNLISVDWKMIFYVAPKLANDASFVLDCLNDLIYDGYSLTIYRMIGPELKYNEEFLINLVRLIVSKYTEMGLFEKLKSKDFREIIQNIETSCKYTSFISQFQILQHELCMLGLRNEKTENEKEAEKQKEQVNEMLQMAESLAQNPENINEGQKDNYVLMLNILKLKPDFYVLVSDRLKSSESFRREAIKCGVTQENVASEYEKILERRRNAKHQRIDREKERNKVRYGPRSEYYALVDNYLDTRESISTFCQKNNLQESTFKWIYDSVTEANPEIKERREARFAYFQNVWGHKVKWICEKILEDEAYLCELAKKEQKFVTPVELVKSSSDKRRMSEIILKAIIAGKLSVNDYIRLFAGESDYEKMMVEVNKFFCFVEELCPELKGKENLVYLARKEMYKFRVYASKFVWKEFVNTKVGYDSGDGRVDYILVTPKRLEEVINYLKNHDEYICRKTVNLAITMFCNSTWKT